MPVFTCSYISNGVPTGNKERVRFCTPKTRSKLHNSKVVFPLRKHHFTGVHGVRVVTHLALNLPRVTGELLGKKRRWGFRLQDAFSAPTNFILNIFGQVGKSLSTDSLIKIKHPWRGQWKQSSKL